ncbi:hypothetical protein ACER0C_002909 [Sarotherodon galilaeus]
MLQVEVEEGMESVQLPFKTTQNLPEDAMVVWKEDKVFGKIIHVYENCSDQPDKQHQVYRDRTKMNEDLLKTGDLSLTLKYPTERDSGSYACGVETKDQWIRVKTVQLKVKVSMKVSAAVDSLNCDRGLTLEETLSTFQQLLHHGGRSLTVTGGGERRGSTARLSPTTLALVPFVPEGLVSEMERSGALWVLSTPKALILESPLASSAT